MQEGGNQIVKILGKERERESLWQFCEDHLSYWGFGDGHLEVGLEMTESCSSKTSSLLKPPKPKRCAPRGGRGVGGRRPRGGKTLVGGNRTLYNQCFCCVH